MTRGRPVTVNIPDILSEDQKKNWYIGAIISNDDFDMINSNPDKGFDKNYYMGYDHAYLATLDLNGLKLILKEQSKPRVRTLLE